MAIEDIPDLEDGDLDPLFGWQSVDLAAWFRDQLHPVLEDPDIKIGDGCDHAACVGDAQGATHVMLMQTRAPIKINANGECGDQGLAEQLAAYWGVEPAVAGQPETAAVFRKSSRSWSPVRLIRP